MGANGQLGEREASVCDLGGDAAGFHHGALGVQHGRLRDSNDEQSGSEIQGGGGRICICPRGVEEHFRTTSNVCSGPLLGGGRGKCLIAGGLDGASGWIRPPTAAGGRGATSGLRVRLAVYAAST